MMDGFLNILKPPGMSSHDVIGAVRKVLHMKRVGHAGTLDPRRPACCRLPSGRPPDSSNTSSSPTRRTARS